MIQIQQDIPLKNKSTFRIGGRAQYYTQVHTDEDVKGAFQWAQEHEQKVFVLGKGSNILISDAGWPGLVIDMSDYTSIGWEGNTAVCQSGALLHMLVKQSVDRGLGGMEELAGIPGSVGGALIMNAGAFKQNVCECLISVSGLYADGSEWYLNRKEVDFGYRSSSLNRENSIILKATFSFNEHDNPAQLQSVYEAILKKRNQNQPLDLPNCGSVFKRPEGMYAGALIEECGLKGYRMGSAMVSSKHANFIVHDGDATAEDVRKLIVHIQKEVYNKKGVLLEPEVLFVGEFKEDIFKPV